VTEEFSLDDAQTLRSYLQWMDVVAGDLNEISSYVSNTVCGDEGYPELMRPVVEALDVAAGFYRSMTGTAVERWESTEQALFDIGRAYQREDGHVSRYFRTSDMERRIELAQHANELRQRKIEEQTGGSW
jgi:hypothetical protein